MKKLLGALTLITLLQSSPIIAQEQSPDRIPVTSSEYIQKVVDSKLMDNFPDGKFYQDKLISRAELASILVKAFYLDKRAIIPEKKSKKRLAGLDSTHPTLFFIQMRPKIVHHCWVKNYKNYLDVLH